MRRKVKAVYTIEAAILIPFTLAVMAFAIRLGIGLYTEVREEAASYGEVLQIDEVSTVHKIRTVGTLWEEIGGDGISEKSE